MTDPVRSWSVDDLDTDGPMSSEAIVEPAVGCVVYRDGRSIGPARPAEVCRPGAEPGTMVWIDMSWPARAQLAELATTFELPASAVADARAAHHRPKMKRHGGILFVVLRAARYVDEAEEVEFGELHIFIGRDFVITIRRGQTPNRVATRERIESRTGLLRHGPEAMLYAILDLVVAGYVPVVAGLDNDIDEIEAEVFRGDPHVSRRIYELAREVIGFRHATHPLAGVIEALVAGFAKYEIDEELQRYLLDVAERVRHVSERADGFHQLLTHILSVNATLVAQQQNAEMKALTEASLAQNEEIKRISAWAAILFAPTLIGTVYGMNFRHLPELTWPYGYPLALALMAAVSLGLYAAFRRRGWL